MLPGTKGVAMVRIQDRASVFQKILWAPLRAIFAFLYGVAAFVAWLLKESGHAEPRLTAWLPAFSWSAWIIGFLLLLLGMALEGAYKIIVKQREQIRELQHDVITDAEVEAITNDIEARTRDRTTAEQLAAVQRRRALTYTVFQKDEGTKDYPLQTILELSDAEKARVKKINPHMWQWVLDHL